MEFQKFEVGKKTFAPSAEGAMFNLTDSGCILIIRFNKPTAEEKRNIKSGVAQFKFTEINGIIFFLSRFGTLSWMDSPFLLDLAQCHDVPHSEAGIGLSLHIMLVDASTGILEAQRLIGLSTDFSNHLADAMLKQPHFQSHATYLQTINSIYDKYSTPDMVDMAKYEN